jgi:hypothetical protein
MLKGCLDPLSRNGASGAYEFSQRCSRLELSMARYFSGGHELRSGVARVRSIGVDSRSTQVHNRASAAVAKPAVKIVKDVAMLSQCSYRLAKRAVRRSAPLFTRACIWLQPFARKLGRGSAISGLPIANCQLPIASCELRVNNVSAIGATRLLHRCAI